MKKLISILLAVCVLMAPALAEGTSARAAAALPDIPATPASAADSTPPPIPTEGDVWDGSIEQPTTLVQKDGKNYYEITKCSQFAYVAVTRGEWHGYNYLLGNNLIFNDVEITWDDDGNCTNGDALRQWPSIYQYTGTFDGGGYTISGLYVRYGKGTEGQGLFGILDNASVSNVKIVNSYVEGDYGAGGIAEEGTSSQISNCVYDGFVKTLDGSVTSDHGCGGICGSLTYGTIENCVNYGDIRAYCQGGGIIGDAYAAIESCKNYGNVSNTYKDVKDSDYLGGIGGRVSGLDNCVNYGAISGSKEVGGLVGRASSTVSGCQNYGTVTGTQYVGGIAGAKANYPIRTSGNYGDVSGESDVGGIAGKLTNDGSAVYSSCNTGNVQGKEHVGGIAGSAEKGNCSSVYNIGAVEGDNYVGGICGFSNLSSISESYNIGGVSGTTYTGGVIGSDGVVWDKDTISDTYFLQTETINAGLNGCGSTVAVEGIKACTQSEMLQQSTYQNFDFEKLWRMDPNQNGGYPYFSWQTVGEVAVSGVTLNKTALSMGVGDSEYLAAAVTPVNAPSTGFTWASSDEQVATVNQAGKVTAVSPGTARITVTTQEGGYSAACDVTVAARTQDEYKINSITLRGQSGDVLTEIPSESFWAAVSLTHQTAAGDTMVLLTSYDRNGKFLNMMCAQAKDLPIGATVELSFLVDNSRGQVGKIKAFPISSFKDLKPVGQAVTWQPQG